MKQLKSFQSGKHRSEFQAINWTNALYLSFAVQLAHLQEKKRRFHATVTININMTIVDHCYW